MHTKKILLIHHRLPYPPHSGMDKARFSLLKALNSIYNVSLLVHNTQQLQKVHIEEVQKHCKHFYIINENKPVWRNHRILKKFRTILLLLQSLILLKPTLVSNTYSRKFKKYIRRTVTEYDFDIIQPLSDYTLNYVAGLKTNAIKFFGPNDDMVGMSESILAVSNNKKKNTFLKIEIRARRHWQKQMIRASDKICYFAKTDMKRILKRNPEFKNKLVWMPGIIEYETDWNSNAIFQVEPNSLIFTGGLVSEFNRLSLAYFFKDIWPLVVKNNPMAKIYIVGQNDNNQCSEKYSSGNIIYTGKVEDMQPWLERAAVFISPVNCGTGIKTKIIEALRFGKPIVSTLQGVSGLWELTEEGIKVRDDVNKFAEEINLLLQNDDYRIETALKARALFEKQYAFNKVAPKIEDIYSAVLKHSS